jgi:hypothetical protein
MSTRVLQARPARRWVMSTRTTDRRQANGEAYTPAGQTAINDRM